MLIRIRRGAAAEWAAANPVLQDGELGLATDTRDFKIGNGTSTWAQLTAVGSGTGTSDYAQLTNKPTLGTAAAKDVGTGTGQVASATDTRLTDARTPTTHTHDYAATVHSHDPQTTITGNAATATALSTGADRTKLDGIAAGATVGADWNTNIANKPTIPAAQVQSDWNAVAGMGVILNKPVIGGGPTYAALTAGATAMGFATESVVKCTPNATATYTTTVPAAGTACFLIVVASGTTSRTITFGSGFKPTGTLATGTVTARVFVVHWISDGVNLYESGRTAAMVA
jgi:hypothetical protein